MPVRICKADCIEVQLKARLPFRYGIATMTETPHRFVRVELDVNGNKQTGIAADHLPPKWFTKNPTSSLASDLAEMRDVIDHALHTAENLGSAETVFDLWLRLHVAQKRWAEARYPALLWSFGVSLVERALMDAFCRATGTTFATAIRQNTFGVRLEELYPDLSGISISDLVPPEPLRSIRVRHTIGLGDPLTDNTIPDSDRINDGLPQSLEKSIQQYGLNHFKIKLFGVANQDCERLKIIAELLRDNTNGFWFSLDGNENYRDPESFIDLWRSLQDESVLKEFLSRLLFVEQPFHREIALSDRVFETLNKWTDRPPLLIDESDGSFGDLPRALACGYIGTSHKNCKGIIKSLANAALLSLESQRTGKTYTLSGEDLSTVGPVALLQDLTVHATLGIDHVERNGHHYFAGLSGFSSGIQQAALTGYPDLYRLHDNRFPTLNIQSGQVKLDSLLEAPFGVGSPLLTAVLSTEFH